MRLAKENGRVSTRCDVGRSPWFMLKPEAGSDQVARAAMWAGCAGFENVAEMTYVKTASCLFEPFFEAMTMSKSPHRAIDSSKSRTDITNEKMLIRKVDLDIGEGANMVIIKPTLTKSGSCQECQGKASDYSVGGLLSQRRICNDKATQSATAFG
jgi:hypothetical protein